MGFHVVYCIAWSDKGRETPHFWALIFDLSESADLYFPSKLVINKLDKSQISQHKCPIIIISTFVAAVLYTLASQLKNNLVFLFI